MSKPRRKRIGTYTNIDKAKRNVDNLTRMGLSVKMTENTGKVRYTPSGRRVLHPKDYPGGKLTKVYRIWGTW